MMLNCPLCEQQCNDLFFEEPRRSYLRCQHCALVFVPPNQRLNSVQEKAEYDKHQNAPDDMGYRRFLSRIADPLMKRIPPCAQGLDFGCGPGPTLSVMLEEQGHKIALFDVFYFPDTQVWQADYDFITATEVIEHLFQPGKELKRLWSHLKPNGHLALMTKLVKDVDAFSRWHYKNDPSHVCFFSTHTLDWLADAWQADLDYCADDAFIFTKR